MRTAVFTISAIALTATSALAVDFTSREKLGEVLYFDTNLSFNRTQACATCHDPAFGFVDSRDNGPDKGGRMTSLGADGRSIGDRNAPTASYAALTPAFSFDRKTRIATGGQFLDGRAATLSDQAGGPPLNPIEMGMNSKADVVARLKENADYVTAFSTLYGASVWDKPDTAYRAMTDAIAAFEGTAQFASFDSKYDRSLRGEYKMTPEEDLGQTLFFSTKFANCNRCHQLSRMPAAEKETFSNYQYHNIGVPANTQLRALNGKGLHFVDHGLAANPAIKDKKAQDGKYKVPTLRNVAVTGPYMHNGVFADLETVVRFYNKYVSKNPAAQVNPETGKPWEKPEVARNISTTELESGAALDERRIKALVAFLKTLTDARFEHLIK